MEHRVDSHGRRQLQLSNVVANDLQDLEGHYY